MASTDKILDALTLEDPALEPMAPEETRRLLAASRRQELAAFVAGALPVLMPGVAYHDNWHIWAISHEVEQFLLGRTPRLLITCPPRHLKSIIASVCGPAWALGNNPRLRLVCLSHTGELAAKHHDDCRRLMESDYYRALFPHAAISPQKNTQTEFRMVAGGGRLSLSVGGPLTGRGGDLIIIDDPIKAEDAASETKRTGVNAWYSETLASRLNDPKSGGIAIVMQRLHDDDLAGHVTEGGGWRHLNLPAIAEDDQTIAISATAFHQRKVGDLLHPARLGQGELDALKADMGSNRFSAQYQQRPAPRDGAIIKRQWLVRFPVAPVRQASDVIIQSWDTAAKTSEKNDYSVCATFLMRGRVFYLLHVLRIRVEFPDLVLRVKQHATEWRTHRLLIEDAGPGQQVLQALRVDAYAPKGIAVKPEGDKVMRLEGQSHKFEAGEVFLPESAPWLDDFINELLAFPKGRHDDQVDAVSQALNWADTSPRPYRILRARGGG